MWTACVLEHFSRKHSPSPTLVTFSFFMEEIRVQCMLTSVWSERVSGLQWENVGVSRPTEGRELHNRELIEKLPNQTQFTEDELKSFDLEALYIGDFVLSGDSYFTPKPKEDTVNRELKVTRVKLSQNGKGAGHNHDNDTDEEMDDKDNGDLNVTRVTCQDGKGVERKEDEDTDAPVDQRSESYQQFEVSFLSLPHTTLAFFFGHVSHQRSHPQIIRFQILCRRLLVPFTQ